LTRVVVDTNVLVSGALSATGPPGWIVEALIAGALTPVFDSAILAEYRDVLSRVELALPVDRVLELIDAIESLGIPVTTTPWPERLPDPDDAPFLAAALAAHCVLVTGNLRHFPIRFRRGVDVASPREFVDRYSTAR
jgi:putative PIN family toxin of toxin-antitoxin system